MRKLMSDQRDQAFVSSNDRRRGKCQPGILHSAIREAGWQDQQVVTTPAIGAVEFLGGSQHLLCVFEFLRRLRRHGWLGIHARARTELCEFEVAHGQSDQIGRNWLRHLKAKLGRRSNENWKASWNASDCVA